MTEIARDQSSATALTPEQELDFRARYRTALPKLHPCAIRLERLLQDVLKTDARVGRTLHTVKVRVKDEESFLEKCRTLNKTAPVLDPISDCYDLLGARVIVYSRSKKEVVAKVLRSTLKQHRRKDHSKIKSTPYQGLHLIMSPGPKRGRLPEWEPYKDQRFEVQITTLAHNAWSEVDHITRYKGDDRLDERRKTLLKQAVVHLDYADTLIEDVMYQFDYSLTYLEEEDAATEEHIAQ